ncbi:MAG: rhodanese [Cyanobacteria bacterium]|nr:rhodanese [Cyanobacteria bacterium CG_2015-16_32_12]NCO77141.1 rhodanese [Cyanobacteria bacterium CG_2015-22_32_23]NCQ05310.1 rhodanese [Cyanobacteria bacterium CG_2015-09_32_10]NCQ42498.1 rhodanese [Cyanobacteria bacterium CG_2015-04_32_10]NCS85395.1 rhodanese [Cyanobacteria bacterium CG_2015-02_32_10]
MNLSSINVQELEVILREENPEIQLIDVREEREADIAFLPQFQLFPLSQYEQWSDKIKTVFKPELETIVICHHGIRSANMCQWLISQGFTKVKNVSGGINAYAVYIDSSIPRY